MSGGSSPSFAAPVSVAPFPTYAPSYLPSAAPSVEDFDFVEGSLVTQMYINEERTMSTIEHELFVGIMEGHTESIGENVTSPFIKTTCTILDQILGTTEDSFVLQVSYHMNYTTHYGYDVQEYPELFRTYMNEQNATTLEKFVDLIDITNWTYIQEMGTTVSVTEDVLESMSTDAPLSTAQPTTIFAVVGVGSKPPAGMPSDPTQLTSSSTENNSSDNDSSSSISSKGSATLFGVLLGFCIVILFTVVAVFVRVYQKKQRQNLHSEEADGVVVTTEVDDGMLEQHELEYRIEKDGAAAAAAAAVNTTTLLDKPSLEEIPPSTPIHLEKDNMTGDDDSTIVNDVIFSFALPIDVSDAEKGIITALDTPTDMMADGDVHHDRFSSGLSPVSFLAETESIDGIVGVGIHDEGTASLGVPLTYSDTERGTVTSSLESVPMSQYHRVTDTSLESSMSHHQSSSDVGNSVTFAPDLTQTVVLEQVDESSFPLDAINSYESGDSEEVTSPQLDRGTFEGANLMAIRSDSLSTESHDDDSLPSQASTGNVVDEFDKYRDQLLDVLKDEVESTVDNVHVPLRLAIEQIFTDTSEQGAAPPLDLSWIGGEDLGSIEASCLCQACAWEQNDSFATGQGFFEDMLNKIVLIVHHGLLTPHDGARILHGCASIVGLSLLKELPNNTVVIQGLITTNELAHGHHLLVSAFEQFGEIVDASIAPQNRGFGFVRFANSESIDKVLNEHRVAAIEIQDVGVSITTLLR